MDEMRAMLDDLMGKERNMPLDEREKMKYVLLIRECSAHESFVFVSYAHLSPHFQAQKEAFRR